MNRVQAKLLEEIMEHDDDLTPWESQFVDNLFNNDPVLTSNQNHKLNQIHQRVVFESWREN